MSLYRLLRPLLFSLPAETAHELTHGLGTAIAETPIETLLARQYSVVDERLTIRAFDRTFSNPIGVAAGFDKNARIPGLLSSLGFGHVEIGAVTARPQAGNPRPRMFRLPSDEAIVNRMGFNNEGADRIADRLDRSSSASMPLGVNLGKSKGVPATDAPADYRYTYDRLAAHGDFFVVNVSSPNTPGLRELQERDRLDRIVTELLDAGATPLLVKISPDLADPAIEDVLAVVNERDLDGVIATNTSVKRSPTLQDPNRIEDGGLSGRPIEPQATAVVRFVAERTAVPVIGVGGVFTAEDAYRKIRAGASLVQLYTGIVYRGPGVAREINRGLSELLERDGYDRIEDAVGADHN